MINSNIKNTCNNDYKLKKTARRFLVTAIILSVSSNFLSANSCSGGACSVTIPQVSTDIENDSELKPFNTSNEKNEDDSFNGWLLIDNGGDASIGENRFLAGFDLNSLIVEGDKLALFGMITDESVTSGKLSYAYPLSWEDMIAEFAYSHTAYPLLVPFPGATGIGTTNSIEAMLTYRGIHSKNTKLNFSFSLNNNNINDEINNNSVITNSTKNSYEATAQMSLHANNLYESGTSHQFNIKYSAGYLSFDNEDDEKLDQLTFNTKGLYTKINIDYKNTIKFSKTISLESNIRSQYAFNDKNLDDSESFILGGINGVKIYEESIAYASNGIYAGIEAKYRLPDISGITNSIGLFYDYGKIWESENLFTSTEDISVQDAGIGIYAHYQKFFSKAQVAYELGNADITTKDDKKYRVILQAGLIF